MHMGAVPNDSFAIPEIIERGSTILEVGREDLYLLLPHGPSNLHSMVVKSYVNPDLNERSVQGVDTFCGVPRTPQATNYLKFCDSW